jgi:hypothetical protein
MKLKIEGFDLNNLINDIKDTQTAEGMQKRINKLFPNLKATATTDPKTNNIVIEGLTKNQIDQLYQP